MRDFYGWEKNIVSTLSGKGVSLPEGSVPEVFDMISRILIDQGEVSLEAIGSFRKREIDGSNRITFIPSRTIRRQLEESQLTVFTAQREDAALFSDKMPATPAGHSFVETPGGEHDECSSDEVPDEVPVVDLSVEMPVGDDRREVFSATDDPDIISVARREKTKNTNKVRQLFLGGAFIVVFLALLIFALSSKLGSRYKIKESSETGLIVSQVVDPKEVESAKQAAVLASQNHNKMENETGFFDAEIVQEGDNLLDFSEKHYGHSCYWVYIFLENRDKLSSPFNLSAGSVLRIPHLEDSGIVTSDSICMSAALNLAIELLEGKSEGHH